MVSTVVQFALSNWREKGRQMNPNNYPVYPEDDGYDCPRNPYSPV
jgi:hypothetical protein